MKSKLFNSFFILWPWIITSYLLAHFFNRGIFDFTPYWSDEQVYWLASKTFRAAGWNGGYFGISEVQAPLSFSHWGLHGPLFSMLYACLNNFFSWQYYSGVLINHVVLSLGLAFFLYALKPDLRTRTFLFLTFATFWCVSQFSTTNMQESWHHFLALVAAGIAARFVQNPNRKIDAWDISAFLLLIYSSAMRPSWSMIFIPLSVLIFYQPRKLVAALFTSVILIGLSPLAFKMLAAPMPAGGAQFVKFMTGSESLWKTLEYFWHNFELFFEGDPTEKNQRIQMVLITLFSGILLIQSRRKKIQLSQGTQRALIGVIFLLLGFIGATLTMYLVGGQADYRVFSAPLLYSIFLILVLEIPWKPIFVVGLLILNFRVLPNYLGNYESFRRPGFTYDRSQITKLQQITDKFITYTPNENAWCNTLLSGGFEPWIYPELSGLSAGIGIQGVWDWKYLKAPLKSQFVLLDQHGVEEGKTVAPTIPLMKVLEKNGDMVRIEVNGWGTLNLQELTRFRAYDLDVILYKNLDSTCHARTL